MQPINNFIGAVRMLGMGLITAAVPLQSKRMFLMFLQKFESLVESCAINIYLLVSYFFPLGELLGDGRDPMATAAFLLFAITEKR